MASHLRAVQNVTMEDLKKFNLIYLATPYALFDRGLDAAAREASLLAGQLELADLGVFSPIAHTHSIAAAAGIDPVDDERWRKSNERFMRVCDCLLVGRLPGWDSSAGVTREIGYFHLNKKPIYHINPETLEVY